MSQIAATLLKTELDDILQRVRDGGEQFEIIEDGREVARIVPAGPLDVDTKQHDSLAHRGPNDLMDEKRQRLFTPAKQTPEERAERLARLDALIEQIGRHLPQDGNTFDATDDLRRDL